MQNLVSVHRMNTKEKPFNSDPFVLALTPVCSSRECDIPFLEQLCEADFGQMEEQKNEPGRLHLRSSVKEDGCYQEFEAKTSTCSVYLLISKNPKN